MSPAARRSRAERARRRAARECRDCAGALRADDGCRCAPCAEYHRGVEAERMRVKRAAARASGAPARPRVERRPSPEIPAPPRRPRPRAERLSPEELARVASLRTRLRADLDALRAEVWPRPGTRARPGAPRGFRFFRSSVAAR